MESTQSFVAEGFHQDKRGTISKPSGARSQAGGSKYSQATI
jgi:hypothetical protein